MYLHRKTYVKNWEHTPPEKRTEVTLKIGGELVPLVKHSEITEEIGYWRKANAIHNWFVKHCQEGNDDCGEYWVSRDKLLELKADCESVLDSLKDAPKGTIEVACGWSNGETMYTTKEVYLTDTLAEDKLPPVDGFFFGSSDIDDWYISDLKNTIEIIDEALSEDRGQIYYQSSW
jgi:hypothetical protein